MFIVTKILSTLRKNNFVKLAIQQNDKMSNEIVKSPIHAIDKTRNAILRMKKCSPELRTILRKRCQERILNNRIKILNSFRKIKIQDSFRVAFGNILKEEWKDIDDGLIEEPSQDIPLDFPHSDFNFDDELLFEELLEKEMLLAHEDWLLQLYEELLLEDSEESTEVVCPLCCLGYLKQLEDSSVKRTMCLNCSSSFTVGKSLFDLQAAIYESLTWHDKDCNVSSGFVVVPKNENENNLCIVCHNCSYLNVVE